MVTNEPRSAPISWNLPTNPSARTKVAAPHFLDRAATPPWKGGEYLLSAALSLFVLLLFASPLPAAAATACENLTSLSLANAKINSAQMVAAGAFVQPGGGGRAARGEGANPFAKLPAFCRVTTTSTPTSDSDIKIEVWLPAAGWNGKFEAVGNGGWAGTIPYPGLASALMAGYAAAGTDTGHVGNSADFALGHPLGKNSGYNFSEEFKGELFFEGLTEPLIRRSA